MPQISYQQEVYRKLIHLSSLWMPVAMCLLSRVQGGVIFLALLVLNVLLEYGYYKKWPVIHRIYHFFFAKMMRNSLGEGKFEFSGGPYVLASALLTVILFEPRIAACAFSVMLIADTAAALVGRKFGRTKFSNGKSLEGILAFVIASVLVLVVCGCIFSYPPRFYLTGGLGIIFAAAAEFYEKKLHIDDNFSIPVIVGIAMSL